MSDSLPEDRWQSLRWLSLIVIVASLLYKFFDRSVLFHDEIINIAVARNGDIFGYAMRPVFYGINALSVRFLGNGTLALSSAAYIGFLIIAAYTYQYIKRDLGMLAATAGVAALAWSGCIYYVGIRGMPHLYPAVFFAAALYHYHQTSIARHGWVRYGLIAALLWLAMLSHPTGVALVIGFFGMVLWEVSLDWRAIGAKTVARILAAWVVSMIALWGIVEGLYYAFSPGHQSYVGHWLVGLRKTSSNAYPRYFEPFGFYFGKLATLLFPLLILTAVLMALLVLKVWRDRKGFGVFLAGGWRRVASLFVVAMLSLLVVSLEKWKFDRVLVTFMPIAILSIVYLVFRAGDSISWKRPLIFMVLAGFVMVLSSISFVGQTKGVDAKFARWYPVYSASSDVIRHLPVKNIGYLGRVDDSGDASHPVQGAGKTLKMMKLSRQASGNTNIMARELMAAGNRYVIVSMRGDQNAVRTFHKLAYESRFSRLAVFPLRQRCELWELAPDYLGEDIETRLEALPRNARLGLLLDGKRDAWLKWTLDDKKFRSSEIKHIPDAGAAKKYSIIFLSTSSKGVKASQASLTKGGMRKVGEIPSVDGKGPIEMWESGG